MGTKTERIVLSPGMVKKKSIVFSEPVTYMGLTQVKDVISLLPHGQYGYNGHLPTIHLPTSYHAENDVIVTTANSHRNCSDFCTLIVA